MNKAMIIGRLIKDPELKQASIKVCSFTVVTSKKNKKTGEEKAQFHNMVAFNKQAELIIQYLKKGSRAYFEGEIETDSWDDKQTGQKRYKTQILVNTLEFLDSKTTNVQPTTPQQQQFQQPQPQQTQGYQQQQFQQPQQQQQNFQPSPPPQQGQPQEDSLPF